MTIQESGAPAMSASEADRVAVICMLDEALTEQRISADEHAVRVRLATRARTLDDLALLTRDLVPLDSVPLDSQGLLT